MKRIFLTLFALVLSVGLAVTDAEAKRLGDGKSIGMKREAAPQAPAMSAAPAAGMAGAAAAPAARKNSWLGPVAGIAAGLGLAALASHLGMGEELASMLMIGLLVMVAVIAFRMLMRKRGAAPAMQYAGMGSTGGAVPMPAEPSAPSMQRIGASVGGGAATLPAGFDGEGFVRQAKVNFLRLQAANDAGNVNDLREFVSPEMFAELQLQLGEREAGPQRTDVMDLQAEIVECVEDAQRYIVSVRFHGLICEKVGTPPERFAEIWHLTKPISGTQGWVVSGIQQVS